MIKKINKRLNAVAALVRAGVTVYDIGTDHAYLPVFLVKQGIIKKAVASDINEGPLKRAQENIASNRLSGAIETVLSDGLLNINIEPPCDIIIAGMGGELISGIIEAAHDVRLDGVRLLLQPMTKPERLREYLYRNGFNIYDETLVKDELIYQIICAFYDGVRREVAEAELLLGKRNIINKEPLFAEHARQRLAAVQKRLDGKKISGADITDEKRLIDEIKEHMKK